MGVIHTYSWFNSATSAESDIVELEGELYDAPTLLYMLVCAGSGVASRERYRNPVCGPPQFDVSISGHIAGDLDFAQTDSREHRTPACNAQHPDNL